MYFRHPQKCPLLDHEQATWEEKKRWLLHVVFRGGLPTRINTLREIWTWPYLRTILPFSSPLARALICKTGYIRLLVYSPVTKQRMQMLFKGRFIIWGWCSEPLGLANSLSITETLKTAWSLPDGRVSLIRQAHCFKTPRMQKASSFRGHLYTKRGLWLDCRPKTLDAGYPSGQILCHVCLFSLE